MNATITPALPPPERQTKSPMLGSKPGLEKHFDASKYTSASAAQQPDRDERIERLIPRAFSLFLRRPTRGRWKRVEQLCRARSPEQIARMETARWARITGGQ